MAPSTSLLLSFFILFFHLFSASSSEEIENTPLTITLPLTPTFTSKPSMDPMLFLQELASESKSRAHLLKYGKTSPLVKSPLYPIVYGGHTISLSFGTPPQKLSYLVDTGSDIVWAPCTTHYRCINCSSSAKEVPFFKPQLSTSLKTLNCKNPRCTSKCTRCKGNPKNCPQICPFFAQYGSGAEAGYYLSEDLHFPEKTFHNILVGCATIGIREISPFAMGGFGRSMFSLPVQMGVKKFAYCLKSHYFDNTRNSSNLIFDYRDGDTKGLSYTPFLKNPPDYPIYYYLVVKNLMLGNKILPIPSKYIAPGSNGSGGLMIDSGFAYGYMAGPVFKIVTNELKKQMYKYKRSRELEELSGFTPCYNFTGSKIEIPDLIYHFTGGATMVVPGNRYFRFIPEIGFGCFPVTTDAAKTLEFTPGPSIILGNYMQVNHYIEYDLKNDRLGFRQQTC